MAFIKQILRHDEVRRGASHVLVGVAIAIVSTLLFKESVQTPVK